VTQAEPVTPKALARIAREIYIEGPWATRQLQYWRPFICPFDLVVEEVPDGSVVLDVGCGGGLLLGALASLGRIRGGVGFDYSDDAIRVAQAMAGALPAGCDLQFHHVSALDRWPEGTFSAVTLIDVMHHVPPASQHDVFRTAARHLKPGARLIYKDIAPRPRWRAYANTLHDLLLARQWVHYVDMSQILDWAHEEGLVPVRSYTANRLWYGHHFAVFQRPSG
jgi:2-polyprenyl-3-methyl-5-hydroxy-6-metoxy-1,4-benzoquinol methylase